MDPYSIALQCPRCGETSTLTLDPLTIAQMAELDGLERALVVPHRHRPRPRPDAAGATARGAGAAPRPRRSPRPRRIRPHRPLGSDDGS
jgi:hypothetical protein